MRPRFEGICRQFLLRLQLRLPAVFYQLGGWLRGGGDIDLVGIKTRQITVPAKCNSTKEWVKPGALLNRLARMVAEAYDPEVPAPFS